MTKGLLRKLCRAFYLQDSLPDTITLPANDEGQQAFVFPLPCLGRSRVRHSCHKKILNFFIWRVFVTVYLFGYFE